MDISEAVNKSGITYDFSYIYHTIIKNSANYNPAANYLKESHISSIDLRQFGFPIQTLCNLGYNFKDLYDASYSILEIPNYDTYIDLSYTFVGYSLTDISNAGYSLTNFTKYVNQLPTILENNHIYVSDWKNIQFTVSQIYNFRYSLIDIRKSYTLLEIIDNSTNYTVVNLKNAGYSASDLSSVGFTASQLYKVYSLDKLMTSGYSISNLRISGYTASDFLKTNYFNKLGLYSKIVTLYVNGYMLTDLSKVGFNLRDVFNALYNTNKSKLSIFMNDLLSIYSADEFIYYGFTAFDLYTLYNISLDRIQKIKYSSTDIRTINSYKTYYGENTFPKPNIYSDISNVSLIDLCNNHYIPDQLIAKIMTNKTDISNTLAYVNHIYEKYQNTDISNILRINTAIVSYNNTELINNHYPYQYNYTTILPFGDTRDVSGTDAYFKSIKTYNRLFLTGSHSSFYFEYNTIYLYGYNFTFCDITKNTNNVQAYTAINIYTTGWLGFYSVKQNENNNIVFSLRYFPFDLQTISVKYTFWVNSEHNILEIIVNGTDIQGVNVQITIHIDNTGLITLCNGDGNAKIYIPGNIRYSEPDPTLITISNASIYYCVPMAYYYDNLTSTIKPTFYDFLRIDLRNQSQDPITGLYERKGIQTCGYLANELIKVYSLSQLSKCCTVYDLKNLGYSAETLYELNYSAFDIAVAYNIIMNISGIINYT